MTGIRRVWLSAVNNDVSGRQLHFAHLKLTKRSIALSGTTRPDALSLSVITPSPAPISAAALATMVLHKPTDFSYSKKE